MIIVTQQAVTEVVLSSYFVLVWFRFFNNNDNIYFRTKIKNICAYTITNTADQPITREMFEIGSRIR